MSFTRNKSKEEPETIFGGFAFPKWHNKNA